MESTPAQPVRLRRLLTGAAIVLMALAAAVAPHLAGGERSSAPHEDARPAADASHTPPAGLRTLLVSRSLHEPAPSQPGAPMRASRIRGHVPGAPVMATVLSDADCAPDERGISHCRNRLELPGGRRLTVRHPHDMTKVPCMTPGERVHLVAG